MKRLVLLAATLFLIYNSFAQVVNIPDINFKTALVNDTLINTNQDTEIQVAEAASYTGIMDVSMKFISDLTGIEAFTSLTYLNCCCNTISTLDVSNNIALDYLDCNSLNLTNIDLSNNTALTYLNCSFNPLGNLNISNNVNLNELICVNNQLNSINLSNNTALIYLWISENQLSNLDLSNNTNLTILYCNNNELNNLDFNNNPALTSINCYNNHLISLDVSNNPALLTLRCYNNYLYELNVQNGNNVGITVFSAGMNPNLYCVQVDDAVYSLINWSSAVDSQVVFSPNCFYNTANADTIRGKVVLNETCIYDSTELGLQNIIVKTSPETYYGCTNHNGEYIILTDSGTYMVEPILPQSYAQFITPVCPDPNYHTVQFDSLGMIESGIDFYNEGTLCPYLTIDIISGINRRCFPSYVYIDYCNNGFTDANNVEVHVQLPDYIIFLNANYPFTIDSVGNYVFDIGPLAVGECGSIYIEDSIACINGITGLTQCTEAWITPTNDCVNQLDTTYNQWDHSSVMVEGECVGDTIVRFTITNTGALGSGDMQQPSEYRIFEDGLLVYTGTFQLLGGETMVIDIPANGMTYRLEADQHPMHPGNSHPNETIEVCGSPNNSTGFVDIFPMDDADPEIEIDCSEIVDSYDPNDKSISPQGVTSNNYVMPGTELDYVIRFQNTGTAEAINIIIVDSISEFLDISTFQAGISSHAYTLDVRGQGQPVLFFQFFNINLPDSTTDEPNSHGFVKFKISSYDSLPNNTIIENTADIYFDYNLPVITNTTFVTISDTILIGNPIVIYGIDEDPHLIDVKIYPNPTTGIINIIAEEIEKVEVMNIEGRRVYSGKENEIDLSQQSKGIYIIKVTTVKGVAVEKIVLE